MAVTVPASGFAAHSRPAPKASAPAPRPTSMVRSVRRSPVSTRQTVPSPGALIHRLPSPSASEPTADAGIRSRWTIALRLRLTRAIVLSSPNSQTPSGPAATARA